MRRATGEGVRSPVAGRFDHKCAAKTWAAVPPLKAAVLVGSMVSGSPKSRCSIAPAEAHRDNACMSWPVLCGKPTKVGAGAFRRR
ncbi:hypothetical protein GCM10022419_127280 [Nonomuraea rosea]|uniref:Uncharacterized protein n=1 Tax=Nonomuraea rosea TaxID=638574 RepID=A0ABP6ZYD0_9ACTN